MKTYKTKSQTLTGIELVHSGVFNEKEYIAGSTLMTDESGKQYVLSAEQVAANLDEVKPKTRNKPTV